MNVLERDFARALSPQVDASEPNYGLTLPDIESVQAYYVRAWLCRKRRRDYLTRRAIVKHYDMGGRLIGTGQTRHAPQLTTFQEDRARVSGVLQGVRMVEGEEGGTNTPLYRGTIGGI